MTNIKEHLIETVGVSDRPLYGTPIHPDDYGAPKQKAKNPFEINARFSGVIVGIRPDDGDGDVNLDTIMDILAAADGGWETGYLQEYVNASKDMTDIEILEDAIEQGYVRAIFEENEKEAKKSTNLAQRIVKNQAVKYHGDFAIVYEEEKTYVVNTKDGRTVCSCEKFTMKGLICAHLKAANLGYGKIHEIQSFEKPNDAERAQISAKEIFAKEPVGSEYISRSHARGIEIYENGKAKELSPGIWRVNGSKAYSVSFLNEKPACTCPDNEMNPRCKHIWAVAIAIMKK